MIDQQTSLYVFFGIVTALAIVLLVISGRESPEQKDARLKREQERLARERERYEEGKRRLEAERRAAVELRERTQAAKREKRKETLGKAAAAPFAAAGIAAGVTRAAYDHTKKHLGPESDPDTFCPQCGTEMDTDFRYCPKCGAPSIQRSP